MAKFWAQVNSVIDDADILLLLLDARMVKETRNREIEDKVKEKNKSLVYVVTKCDIADKESFYKYKQRLKPSVFTSTKDYQGLRDLRELIHIIGDKRKIEGKIKVGVLGYPNVGKSSLINALKGRKSAPTSALSGYTKGIQKIKTGSRIILLDTPGVIPGKERDEMKHAMIGTIDFTKAKEPELVVFELMERVPGKIEKFYNVQGEDFEVILEDIAIKKKIMKKGNIPDTSRMARMILTQWQKGLLK